MQSAKCKVQSGCALLLSLSLVANVRGDEPLRPRPVSILISDDLPESPSPADSRSPYAAWPEQGMRPRPDRETQLAEIHPTQAEWINATYAGYCYRCDAHCRAGCPECIRARALPSDTGRYGGYLVGGGAAFRGEGPFADEGTWGWDYTGHFFRKHVALDWWHGRRYQAGGGQYHTDGPELRHE